jgi:hypothetical protein
LAKLIKTTGKDLEEISTYYPDTCTSPLFDQVTFRRGFIDTAVVQDFMVHLFAEAVFELSLVRELDIDEEWISELGDKVIRGLLRGIGRARLEKLHMATLQDSVAVIEEFAASPHIAGLIDLHLFLPDDGDEAAKVLAASPHLRDLRKLGLSCQEALTDVALRALLDSPHLSGLNELEFDCEGPDFSAGLRRRYEARFGKKKRPSS